MIIKKFIFVYLFLVSASISFAQNDKAQIKADIEKIIAYIKEMKLKEVVRMTYPPFVEPFSEEEMEALASIFLNDMDITFEENPLNLKLSEVLQLKEAQICMAEYDVSRIIELKSSNMLNFYIDPMKPDVQIEELSDTKLRISGKEYILAINDAKTKNTWKYITYDDEFEITGTDDTIVSREIMDNAEKLRASFKKDKP